MTQAERLQLVQETTAELDTYLQDEPWSDWQLIPKRGLAYWKRTRQLTTTSPLVRTHFGLVVTSRASACEDPGPMYVLDGGEGMIRRQLTVSHQEEAYAVRRRHVSLRVGPAIVSKHGIKLQTDFADVPDLIPRTLIAEERAAHEPYGGSKKPQIIASDNTHFNFEIADWAPSAQNPEGVIIVRNPDDGSVSYWNSSYESRDVVTGSELIGNDFPEQLALATELWLP